MGKRLIEMVTTKIFTLLLTCAGLAATGSSSADATLITNGDFEAGLAGWTITDQAGGSGTFFAQPNDGSAAPLSGNGLLVNATGGTMFALTDQGGPGAHALTQSFVVPVASPSVTMTFDMFLNDYSGLNPTVDPAGLDYSVPGPNQYARVDILTSTASPLSTAAIDIVTSVLFPVPAGLVGVNPWVSSPVFDLTAALGAGGTFQVRFAEVDNSGFFNLGVDNVVITAGAAAVPEPSSLAIFSLVGVGVLWKRRRRALQAA